MGILRAAAVAALVVAGGARADEAAGWELETSVPLDYIGGHTTYDIRASDGVSSIRSELVFPLQSVLAGLRVVARSPWSAGRGTRWVVEVAGQHSLDALAGKLKDSDWIDGPIETDPQPNGFGLAAHPGKDIYSTSHAGLSALVLDGRVAVQHALTPALLVGPVWGVLYQDFRFAARDVNQVGYGPYASGYTVSAPGVRAISYEVAWIAPYMGARAELSSGRIGAALEGWLSPFAMGKDRDDHEMRQKLSETDARGYGWQARGECRYAVDVHDAVLLQASVVGFYATGKQVQTDYAAGGGPMGDIRSIMTSLRWSVGLAWTHRM